LPIAVVILLPPFSSHARRVAGRVFKCSSTVDLAAFWITLVEAMLAFSSLAQRRAGRLLDRP